MNCSMCGDTITRLAVLSPTIDKKKRQMCTTCAKKTFTLKGPDTTEVECQNPGCKKKLHVISNQPYFGILCSECSKPHTYTSEKPKHY
jgi:hypothetical protein